jgi:hypothetical protein
VVLLVEYSITGVGLVMGSFVGDFGITINRSGSIFVLDSFTFFGGEDKIEGKVSYSGERIFEVEVEVEVESEVVMVETGVGETEVEVSVGVGVGVEIEVVMVETGVGETEVEVESEVVGVGIPPKDNLSLNFLVGTGGSFGGV